MANNIDLEKAHKHCFNNKEEIDKSDTCGCFYCREIFAPSEIKNWIEDMKDTAQCPYCMTDSVIGNASGYTINTKFLDVMHKKWSLPEKVRAEIINKILIFKK